MKKILLKKFKPLLFLSLLSLVYIFLVFTNYHESNQFPDKFVIIGDSHVTSFVTVVSVFVALNKSKHSQSNYDLWVSNFLNSVDVPLILLCDEMSLNNLIKLRQNRSTTFYIVNNIKQVLKKIELERKQNYASEYYYHQLELDREKNIHNPNLYAIWNLKSYISNLFAQLNPYKSEYFIYSDAGAWRDNKFKRWPNKELVKQLRIYQGEKIFFGQISPLVGNPLTNDIIEGGFFAGSKLAMKNFYDNFFYLHDIRLKEGKFVGKDQIILNLMAFKFFNDSIVRLRTWNLNCNRSYNAWFFYQRYFAYDEDYLCNNNRYSLLIN